MGESPRAIAVLGQGIAGTLVSMRLREAGLAHVVYDRGHGAASSRAAAGLVNPATGRRFVLVSEFEAHVARFGVYRRLGKLLGGRYVVPLTIYRDLSSVKDRNQWDLRRSQPAYRPYLGAPVRAPDAGLPLANPDQWLGPTTGAYRVDLPTLIRDYRGLLRREGRLREATIPLDRPIGDAAGAGFAVGEAAYTHVIDCRGAACAKTIEWADRPWRLSKGESARLTSGEWPRHAATKLGGSFLAPIGTGADVWYGGTSTDDFVDARPTSAARERFRRELGALLGERPDGGAGALADHRAAIRPTMRDRAVIAAAHASIPGLYACNGLGTKGALMAPSASARVVSILRADLAARR